MVVFVKKIMLKKINERNGATINKKKILFFVSPIVSMTKMIELCI